MGSLTKLKNVDRATLEGFGGEWSRFDQKDLSQYELQELFQRYFRIFPWSNLRPDAVGFDAGCGSGRWAQFVSPRVGLLHCIDASEQALNVAKVNLNRLGNVVFHCCSVDDIPIPAGSMDFGYSLGVLHHVPDTQAGLNACVDLLKPGAPFLVYLYYSLDNRPRWFRLLWRLANGGRLVISRSPPWLRYVLSDTLAATVYYPLARVAHLLNKAGLDVSMFPLSSYHSQSFYTMRTDSLDRFGTKLEQRFSRQEISKMMDQAGLERITFSDEAPYWCGVGYKK